VRVIADLHLHSRYALATSKESDLEHLAAGAKFKGVNLLATGDFTHPRWQAELKGKLKPGPGDGVYSYGGVSWVLGTEVSTVYQQEGKTRKVHHLVFAPDLDVVAQITDSLSRYGRMVSDGRPVLKGLSSMELVERLTAMSRDVVIIPAHAWTPWFGVLGSRSGFDSLVECYGDMAQRIFAIETGLSSDPPMNWRLSSLDGVCLISNSDAHSANPWRLGRESNAFDLQRLSYSELFGAIRARDSTKFLHTIEVDPAYGKYHFSGHSKCGVSLPPNEAMKLGNRCPRCGKRLTVGVLQRIEELSDRPEGYAPPGAIPYRRLLPLYEVISFASGVRGLYAKKVIRLQDALVRTFGSEFAVLLEVPRDELVRVAGAKIANAIVLCREGGVVVTPGFDGVYGVPHFS